MMKKAMLLMAVVFTLSGCVKKGDEDPLVSMRSRKARLTGTWEVQQVTIADGVNLMQYSATGQEVLCNNFEYQHDFRQSDYLIEFKKDETASFEWNFDHNIYSPRDCAYEQNKGSVARSGNWEFTDQKEALNFTWDNGDGAQREHFEIVRLANRDLILTYETLLPVIVENGTVRVAAPTLYTATVSLKRVD